jgi:hypothetical protein
MEHFVRIILKKGKVSEALSESVFPNRELLETTKGNQVVHIPLERALSESEADDFADRLTNYLLESGYQDFDIEISAEQDKEDEKLPFDVSEDLIIFMRNDPMFYRKQLYPKLLDVQEAVKNGGKFRKKDLLPVIERAIQEYITKFNIKKLPEELLNDSEKLGCIDKLLADEKENFKKGIY